MDSTQAAIALPLGPDEIRYPPMNAEDSPSFVGSDQFINPCANKAETPAKEAAARRSSGMRNPAIIPVSQPNLLPLRSKRLRRSEPALITGSWYQRAQS